MSARCVTLGEAALAMALVAVVAAGLTHAYDGRRTVPSYLGDPAPYPTDYQLPSARYTDGNMNVAGDLYVGGNLVVGGNVRADSITAHVVADDHHIMRCEMLPR